MRGVLVAAAVVVLSGCSSPISPSASASAPSPTPRPSPAATPAPVLARLPLPFPDAQTAFDTDIAVTKDAIWVADARGTHLVRIDVATDRVTSVPVDPPFLASDGRTLWMVSPYGGAPGPSHMDLSRVDLVSGRPKVMATIPPANRLAVGLGAVWVAVGDIRALDPASGKLLRSFPEIGTELMVGCGALWTSNLPGSNETQTVLGRLDDRTGNVLERVALPATFVVARLGDIGDACWTTSGDALIGVKPGHGIIAKRSPEFGSFQIAGGSVWQWDPPGLIQRFDPAAGRSIGPRWQLPNEDLHANAKGQPDWRLLSAGGSLWLLTGDEIVRYDILSAS